MEIGGRPGLHALLGRQLFDGLRGPEVRRRVRLRSRLGAHGCCLRLRVAMRQCTGRRLRPAQPNASPASRRDVQVLRHRLGRPPAGRHRAVDRRGVAVVAADVQAVAEPHRPLRARPAPGPSGPAGRGGCGTSAGAASAARPGRTSRSIARAPPPSSAASSLGRVAEHRHGDQRRPRRGVARGHVAHHGEVVDRPRLVGVQHQDRLLHAATRRPRSTGSVTARDAGAFIRPPSSRAAAGPSVATTTAFAAQFLAAAQHHPARLDALDRGVQPHGRRPAGGPRAARGIAPMPGAGTAASPSANMRNTNRNIRLDVTRSRSRKMPPKNGRKKSVDHRVGEPAAPAEEVERQPLRPAELVLDLAGASPSRSAARCGACRASVPIGAAKTAQAGERVAARVGQAVEPAAEADQGAAVERLQVERAVVEDALGLGVGGEQDLKAAVEAEAVDGVGADAAADAVGRFDDAERDADLAQPQGAAQPGQPRSDDQHVRCGHVTSHKNAHTAGGVPPATRHEQPRIRPMTELVLSVVVRVA